jgi:UDPglucose 6-dehydrogenase
VLKLNEYQRERFVQTMLNAMFNTLAGKRIAVLGFAFKPGTSDTRDSPALTICRLLLEERAALAITDPRALESAKENLKGVAGCAFVADPYEATRGAHAVAVLTAWPEYRDLDFRRVFDGMEKPAFLFDGWNFLDHAALAKIGFHVHRVGAAAPG